MNRTGKAYTETKARQDAGLLCVAEAARLLGVNSERLYDAQKREYIAAPTHVWKNYTRRFWTIAEVEAMRPWFENKKPYQRHPAVLAARAELI